MAEPMVLRSSLTGQWYVSRSYTDLGNGAIAAKTKQPVANGDVLEMMAQDAHALHALLEAGTVSQSDIDHAVAVSFVAPSPASPHLD